MLTLISTIPIDVLEIIIVSSKNYELFETIKKVIVKLQEPSRMFRINDKLTICKKTSSENGYKYELDGYIHREYDKPAWLYGDGTMTYYLFEIINRKNDHPAYVNVDSGRIWCVNDMEHRENDFPSNISSSGYQEWMLNEEYKRKNNLKTQISVLYIDYTHNSKWIE